MAVNKWKHSAPREQLKILIKRFGKPDYVANVPGGMAVWLKRSLKNQPWEEIMLRDEFVPHNCPAPHHDFLTSWVRVDIHPASRLNDVKQLSGSVFYDGLKKMLGARCQTMEANIATIKIALDIINGNLTIKEIHEKELYGKAISSTVDPANTKLLMKSIKQNLRPHKNAKPVGFWKGAFLDKNCTRPLAKRKVSAKQISDKPDLSDFLINEKKCQAGFKQVQDKPEFRDIGKIMKDKKVKCVEAVKIFQKKRQIELKKLGVL